MATLATLSSTLTAAIAQLNTDLAATPQVPATIAADQTAVFNAQLAVNANLCSNGIISNTPASIITQYLPATMTITATSSVTTYSNIGDTIIFPYKFQFPFAIGSLKLVDANSPLVISAAIATVANALTNIGSYTYTVVAADMLKSALTLPVLTVTGNIAPTADISTSAISISGINTLNTNNTTTTPVNVVFTCPTITNSKPSSLTMTVASAVQTAAGVNIPTKLYSAVGDQIVYTITNSVTSYNSVNASLTSTPTILGFDTNSFTVTPGSPVIRTVTVTVTQAMINAGQYANSFAVTGLLVGTATAAAIVGSASITINTLAAQLAVLNITGVVSPTTFSLAGQNLKFTLTVTSPATNNVTLSKVQIFLLGVSTPLTTVPAFVTLTPGISSSTTFTCTYKTTSADLNTSKELIFSAQNINGSCTVSSNSLRLGASRPLCNNSYSADQETEANGYNEVNEVIEVKKLITQLMFSPSRYPYTKIPISSSLAPLISFNKK